MISLLRHCLSGYGPNILPKADHDRWQRAYDDGDEDAFCTQMSADYIVDMLDEFLGYFMVRKVIAGQDLLRASGTVTKKLVRWLQDQGVVDPATADHEAGKAAGAARDLPNAERLANALYELSLSTPIRDHDDAERWIEHDLPLTITIQPGERSVTTAWRRRGQAPGMSGPHDAVKRISDRAGDTARVQVVAGSACAVRPRIAGDLPAVVGPDEHNTALCGRSSNRGPASR